MTRVDWRHVRAADFPVPDHTSLQDLTAELTELLGSPDPELRDELAVPVLRAWIARGVYDDLLTGLGDGIVSALTATATPPAPPSDDAGLALRRSRSATIVAACIQRDTAIPLLPGGRVLDWADRIATWWLSEQDLRPHLGGSGWLRSLSHGADALGVIASSPHCGRAELSILLDVIGERVRVATPSAWAGDEADRMAAATVRLLRRGLLTLDQVELWVATIGDRAFGRRSGHGAPDPVAVNADAFVRALYLHLALAPEPPQIRADLLLTVVAVLREMHPDELGGSPGGASAGRRSPHPPAH